MGIGDWGLGIGDWAQSPIPNPQSPIPNPQSLNSVVAGFSTGYVLAIRGGFRRALSSGIFGGVFLAVIELLMKIHTQYSKRKQVQDENKQINEMQREMKRAYAMKSSLL